MSKRKRLQVELGIICQHHALQKDEVFSLRTKLLDWYDRHKRSLPWREEAKRLNINERAYAVWVSEIMLQQTQVVTVIDYYKKWMKKWPTVKELSNASLEEVHQVWSGLGYYSRGTRLREGAKKIMQDMDGKIPGSAEELEKLIPGIGRYTAGAISSIAYGQVTGVVDGNVGRVFSRLRAVGTDSTGATFTEQMWKYANETVDETRPGDFNQAVMELGATVCTPKNPSCSKCPVQNLCVAFKQVQKMKKICGEKLMQSNTKDDIADIEEVSNCKLCMDEDNKWDNRKGKKKQARRESTVVCIFHREKAAKDPKYLITQRPASGLLAGLWEFPSKSIEDNGDDMHEAVDLKNLLPESFDVPLSEVEHFSYIKDVVHLFSHIHQTYLVYSVKIKTTYSFEENSSKPTKWVTKEEFLESAVSTAMKKVLKSYESSMNKTASQVKKVSSKSYNGGSSDGKKQLAMDAFIKKK